MKLKPLNCLAVSLTVCLLCFTQKSQAGTFTDNFDSNHDYLNNGVAGTHWSGMTAGTNTVQPATIADWDANVTAPGTLTITNTGGSQADGGDSPYLWTVVRGGGDFTNTVHVSGISQINYNMAGLLIQDPSTPPGQNYLYVAMFAEFGFPIDMRDTTNGVSQETTYINGDYVETNSATWPSWLQITRVAGVLTVNVSEDDINWQQAYQSPRTDLTNDLQVGIFDSTFTANQCSAQFQNFSISGPSVNTNTPPTQATGLSVTTPASYSLNISWSPGAGSAGSIVVVRQALPITRQPLNGATYSGYAVFGAGTDLGESNYVAYVGSGNSLVLTNIQPAIPYTVVVYSYSGSGASTVYALTNAPTVTAVPAGTITGITLSFANTNTVAVDDTIQATVLVNFDNGSSVAPSTAPSFSSGNPSIATISTAGVASALTAGTVAITASYLTFSTSSNLTVVKLPVTDDFSTPRNYLAAGIAGTFWNGLYLDTNDVPFGGNPAGPTTVTLANADISVPDRLTVSSHDGGYGIGTDSGFFLYRIVNGDFSIAIQIPSFQSDNGTNAFHMPGLMVRAPFDLDFTEHFMQWVGFNEYSIGNFERQAIDGAYTENFQQPLFAQPYIMIQRQTNTFYFYQKAHALDTWTLVGSQEDDELAGVPLQVGIVDQTFTANTASSEYANLVLTVPGGLTNNANAPSPAAGLTLTTNSTSGQVTATWTPGTGSSGSVIIAHPWLGVTRQPSDGDDYSALANADFTVGDNLGGSNVVVYAGSGSSVVISNLPASQCYFSVYSYAAVTGTNYYNLFSPATGSVSFSTSAVIAPLTITPGSVQITGAGATAAASFSFTNASGLSFSICGTNNITAPISSWPVIGTAVENPAGSGQYQFTDPSPATNSIRFYILRQP